MYRCLLNSENRRNGERNQVLRTLDSGRHLKDLMGSDEFREEDKKGIDVPFFDLESILTATNSFSDAKKLGEGACLQGDFKRHYIYSSCKLVSS
jgi:hypothetical protein